MSSAMPIYRDWCSKFMIQLANTMLNIDANKRWQSLSGMAAVFLFWQPAFSWTTVAKTNEQSQTF